MTYSSNSEEITKRCVTAEGSQFRMSLCGPDNGRYTRNISIPTTWGLFEYEYRRHNCNVQSLRHTL
jgi:hypothetical protein